MALADVIVIGLPFAAAFCVWSLASLIIVGSPFETFTSVYGGSNQIALSIESIRRTTGETPAAALGYAARQIIGLHPLLLPIVGAAGAAALIRRDARVLAVGAIFGSIILFSLVLFLAGKSFGWLRFYIGIVPLGAMAAAYLISLAKEPGIEARRPHLSAIRRSAIGLSGTAMAGVRSSASKVRATAGPRWPTTETLGPVVDSISPHVARARVASAAAATALGSRGRTRAVGRAGRSRRR